jgi:hypothetical protein
MVHLNINIYELTNKLTGITIYTTFDHTNDEDPFEGQYFNSQLEVMTAIETLNATRG